MGECGCANFSARWKMRAPKGGWYYIDVYLPCNNGCETPAGVRVGLLSAADAKSWGLDDVEELPLAACLGEVLIGVLHPDQLVLSLRKGLAGIHADLDDCEDDEERGLCLDEAVAEIVSEGLPEAILATCEEEDREWKKMPAKRTTQRGE